MTSIGKIPIVRKEMARLVKYIAAGWTEARPHIVGDIEQALLRELGDNRLKLLITGLSRPYDFQKQLYLTLSEAAPPDDSLHICGIDIDFGMRSMANSLARAASATLPDRKMKSEDEAPLIEDIIHNHLERIVDPLHRHHVNELPLIQRLRESNGCFHVSLNVDPDTLAELDRLLPS